MFLDFLFKRVRILPFGGDTELASAASMLKQGSIEPALTLLKAQGDLELRGVRLGILSDVKSLHNVIERAASLERPAPEALMLLGVKLLYGAWEARGSGWKPKNFGEFQRRLSAAADQLDRAVKLAPRDPLPYASLLTVAKGQQRETGEITSLFERGRALAPDWFALHEAYRDAIAPKWGGPDGMADDFVRSVVERAPAGAALHGLAAVHAVESMMDQDGPPQMYFTRAAVRNALKHSEASLQAAPSRVSPVVASSVRNYLAFGYWLGGNAADARTQLQRLRADNAFDEAPWHLIGEPEKVIRSALRECRA